MLDALVGLLDKVDIAVAEARGVLAGPDLEVIARTARDIRLRLSYPESIVVAALAGGTGSGKSSVLNAVAGEEVALTGGIRPMTSTALSLAPSSGHQAMTGYLDELGIVERAVHDGPSWLCLIDLPDNDSVEVDHRHRVDSLLPRVDVVIWVTDPEKYRDASLHQGHIAPLAGYQSQFVFVLNQVDRLTGDEAILVEGDLEEALREDGIDDPKVISTSASPAAGPPVGVDELLSRLETVAGERDVVHRKLVTDLAAVTTGLTRSSSGARGVDFESRWNDEVQKAVALALGGNVADGGHGLGAFLERVSAEVQGETVYQLRELASETPHRFLRCAVEAGARSTATVPDPRPWWRKLFAGGEDPQAGQAEGTMTRASLTARVEEAIGGPARAILERRGRAHAAIADLAIALGDLEGRRH